MEENGSQKNYSLLKSFVLSNKADKARKLESDLAGFNCGTPIIRSRDLYVKSEILKEAPSLIFLDSDFFKLEEWEDFIQSISRASLVFLMEDNCLCSSLKEKSNLFYFYLSWPYTNEEFEAIMHKIFWICQSEKDNTVPTKRLLSILSGIRDTVFLIDNNLKIFYANKIPSFCKNLFSSDMESLQSDLIIIMEKKEISLSDFLCLIKKADNEASNKATCRNSQNELHILQINPLPTADEQEKDLFMVQVLNDDEDKQSNQILKKLLLEKEALLKEVHHRVKNNLQIISSIFNLQMFSCKDPTLLDILTDSRNRIFAMSLIHQLIYRSTDFTSLNVSQYIRDLSSYFTQSKPKGARQLDFNLDMETIYMELDRAIPFGLLVTEILTNNIRHDYTEIEKAEISIFLHKEQKSFVLIISDNGTEETDEKDGTSLGVRLINSLAEQLEAEIKISSQPECQFDIRFPINT